MNGYIQEIKKEILRLQGRANSGGYSQYDVDTSFRDIIKPILNKLNFSFSEPTHELFFPVTQDFLYRKNHVRAVSRRKNGKPLKEFFAIVNFDEDYTISCVDDSYILVSHKNILDHSKILLCHLFEIAGEYEVIDFDQPDDKCRADFDITPSSYSESATSTRDERGETWNFFLRVSNTYYNNIKKFHVGFINKYRDKKVIFKDENSIELTLKKSKKQNIIDYGLEDLLSIEPPNDDLDQLLLKEIIRNDIGDLNKIINYFITLLNRLNGIIIPQIFKPLFFCEDFEIKDEVDYVEKINKEEKNNQGKISAAKRSRRDFHMQNLYRFANCCNFDDKINNYTVYDLFSDYISFADTMNGPKTLPVNSGKWLQTIESRLEKIDNIVQSNIVVIKRIHALDSRLFISFEEDLKNYYIGVILQMLQSKKTINKKIVAKKTKRKKK